MKDYEKIIQDIYKAVRVIDGKEDGKLREITFERLLDDALGNHGEKKESQSKLQTPHDNTQISRKKPKKVGRTTPFNRAMVRDEVVKALDEVTPNQSGIKTLKSLKEKWQQYLWVLEVGKLKGVASMSNAEIAYVLDDMFSLGVTEKQVNNLTFKVKEGYVQKRTIENGLRAWRILAEGSELLKQTNKADEKND